MFPALMAGELVIFPEIFAFGGMVALLLFGMQERAQGHIGRLGIVGNSFFLWQFFYAKWVALPELMQIYLNLATVFAVVALISYLLKESLPTIVYRAAFLLYGSISVLLVLLSWIFGFLS